MSGGVPAPRILGQHVLFYPVAAVPPGVRARASDFTQELPRKLLPTRAKEPQTRRRKNRLFTRRCLWLVGSSLDLKRACTIPTQEGLGV
jgi:hypothetical protein